MQQLQKKMRIRSGRSLLALIAVTLPILSMGQIPGDTLTKFEKDSLFIAEVEDVRLKPKVLHAEPLYIDLIRDLGARKGEHEWNVGFGLTDNLNYDNYLALIEYEWAPIDRLGFEVELPFSFYAPMGQTSRDSIPANTLESLKLATQWSFYVNEKHSTTLALGYIHQFETSSFQEFGNPMFTGNLYNPFFIAAKRWGQNFHTLLYSGMQWEQYFATQRWRSRGEAHLNLHYMIPGTRNFVGIEMNNYIGNGFINSTLRPQMRVGIADNFLVGIVAGIPLNRDQQRISSFVRLIYEPKTTGIHLKSAGRRNKAEPTRTVNSRTLYHGN